MPRQKRVALFLGMLISLIAQSARSADRDNPAWLLPLPELEADPKVPTLKQALGHGWAEEISSHAEIERYLRALTAAAADRTRLLRYGETIEKRGLYLLVISAPRTSPASTRSARLTSASQTRGRPRRQRPERSPPLFPRSSGWVTECTATRSPRATRP